jgi:hypothetical protein
MTDIRQECSGIQSKRRPRTPQLKRELSLWPEFGSDRGNPRDLSKGYSATTFLSSNPTTHRTRSAADDKTGMAVGDQLGLANRHTAGDDFGVAQVVRAPTFNEISGPRRRLRTNRALSVSSADCAWLSHNAAVPAAVPANRLWMHVY